GDLQRGEQAGGAVADVVVGLLLGNALAQRQNRLGAIQRLDLRLLVDADHHIARGRMALRAFENNQFRSVTKATRTTVVVRGQVWRAASWTSCTREVSPSLV